MQSGSSRSPAEHLRPYWFKPGQSGNPKGRPPREAWDGLVRRVLDEKVTLEVLDGEGKLKVEKRELLIRTLIDGACAGDVAMMREILDREWPKVNLSADLDTDALGAGPLRAALDRVTSEEPDDGADAPALAERTESTDRGGA
jgi:hypothetical protein